MNVLIVDDNLITATVLEDTLRENDYDAVAVSDAEEVLYHLTENPQV
jgi:CheY-like chemotaxis protein